MRSLMLAALAALVGCAPVGSLQYDQQAAIERMRIADAQHRAGRGPPTDAQLELAALTPPQRAQRYSDDARAARENELLERAITSSPDYTAAVRRAAIANVDGVNSAPMLPRGTSTNLRARDAAIAAEESRLSEAVEARRRRRLADQAGQRQGQQDQQAAANCINQGQQIEASMYNRRAILNLEAAATGAQARDTCWANYQRGRQ
ncbi:MAG: hypothetical protein JWR10_3440 [Rubritepida sp.]|nr:hypothetical protein [Rubritepida sp.]